MIELADSSKAHDSAQPSDTQGIEADGFEPSITSSSSDGVNNFQKKSSWKRWFVWTSAGLVLVLLLLIGLTALRLFVSPLSVSSFVSEIEEAAAAALPPGQILLLDDAQISFAENGGLALRLSEVELREGEQLLLSAARIDLEVDILSLFKQQLRPSMVFIPNMIARVQRDKNGRFLIAGQDPGSVGEPMGPPVRSQAIFYDPDEPEFVSFIYSMRRAIQPLADDDLSKRPPRILIKDTEIHFQDDIAEETRKFEKVAFSYNPAGEKDDLWRIDFAVNGHHGRIGFAMAEFPLSKEERGVEGRSIEFRFADVSLPDLAPRFADKSQRFQFSSPVFGGARLDFDLKGALVDVSVALDVGAGRLDFGDDDIALLDEASFRLDWEPELRALRLEKGMVYFGETGGEFRGVAVWPEKRDGDIRIAIEGEDIKLAARDNPNPPKLVKNLILQAKVGRESGIGTIERFGVLADEGSLQGAGSMALVNGELTAGMTFVFSEMPYDLISHMWPVSIANGAREWIIKNVEAGKTTGGTIEVALSESMFERNEEGRLVLPDDAVQVDFGVRDLRIKGFGDLPPAEKLNGSGVVTGRTFVANIEDGRFVTKQGRHFGINSGKFEIPDHSQKPATGVVVIDAEGTASALGEIVDSEPLHVLRSEKQTASGLKGKASAKVMVRFPFIKDLKKEDVDYSAKVDLKDFSSAKPIRSRKIEKAELTINTDGTRVDIAGAGTIDGLVTRLDLTTSTDDSLSFASNFELLLSDDDRRKMGLDISQWLRGPVMVKVKQGGDRQDVTRVEVDLTKALLAIGEIGWSKKPNVRGKATFDLIQRGDSYQVRSVSVEGDGFSATGSADLSKADGLQKLTISKLHLSRGDRLRIDAVQSKKDFYTIRLTGEVLDLRGKLMANPLNGTNENLSKDSYVLNANIKKVIGLSGHSIVNLTATQHVINGKDQSIRAKGLLDGRAKLDVTTKAGERPTVHIYSDDAGALLRFFGAIDRVLGGRLALSIVLQNGWDHVTGSVFFKDFNISGQVEKQKLTKKSVERVNGNFNKFTMTFSGKKGVYSIINGVVKGPVLGATVGGTVDMGSKSLALSGTYIPAYGVNNFFSRIPLLGRALGNRKNEGLLGITYKIQGNMSNPRVVINPASLLAPGALRKMFEFN
ncbi:hypothetical protein C0081_08895 [Cohaesibacter celericrescens]|uniref:DUF3971 domain-containing protein n=1 Tax=Cohaesibacter celericrescens TaxID=2067669 RepID=A0A2N5XSK4_9HYPH|nr:hypothetical protein C0081_08895 [Cohaesibacter celericrescens]